MHDCRYYDVLSWHYSISVLHCPNDAKLFFQYSTQLRNTHALSNVSVSVYHSIFADVWYTFSNAHCSVRPNTTQHDHAQPTDQSSKNFCCLIICLGHAFNPPDIISQIMVAIPLIIIFEITIIMAKRIQQKRDSSTTT